MKQDTVVINSPAKHIVGGGKERSSNIELLRIIAMFLVLVVHADYFSLGAPDSTAITSTPLSAIARCFFESCSITCVNIFVLISGWFGIKPSLRGFGNFIFLCAYFLFGIFAVMVLTKLAPFSVKGLASCFLALNWNWFIKAYICLYILSPVLNSFCKEENKRPLRMVLLVYFLFQTMYGWLTPGAEFIEYGYSTISFIGLYLLARYVRLFAPSFAKYSVRKDIAIIIISVLGLTIGECLRIKYHLPIAMMAYTNPLVIYISLYTLILFSKFNFQSKTINWIAASSFAVFLLHTNYNVCKPYFTEHVRRIFESYDGVQCIILIFVYLISVYVIAIVFDQPRKWIFNKYLKTKLRKIDDRYQYESI